MLRIAELSIRVPGGDRVLSGVSLDVSAGQALVVLGPSGSGKTTLLRGLFDRETLIEEGFEVEIGSLAAQGSLGLVPQRGALFDHLDVAGNIELAVAHGERRRVGGDGQVRHWLKALDLDESWASGGRPVGHLSGGEAQRVAVARTLASGRRILFLDEPSVGLDPIRVRGLAAQLRRICDEEGVALVAVTHDVHFAAQFADRAVLLRDGSLTPLLLSARSGPGCRLGENLVAARETLESQLFEALVPAVRAKQSGRSRSAARSLMRAAGSHLRPFGVPMQAATAGITQAAAHPTEFLRILLHALRQSLLRPLAFYVVVSILLGYTVLFVLTSVGQEYGVRASIQIIGGMYVLALTPPLSAFLFVATSANAVNAWLGGMRLSRQITALEALGIPRAGYLWGPSWLALVVAHLSVAATFALGLLLGGLILCTMEGVPDGWELLTSDLLDPRPERAPYIPRAVILVLVYAVGIASDAIARADEPKEQAEDVTRAMTRSVVSCTLWVVAFELISVFLVHALRGGA